MTAADFKAVGDAMTAIAQTEAALMAERDKRRQLEWELEEAKEKRASLQDAEDHDAAQRLLDGDGAAPAKPRRTSTIADLTQRIPALAAALPIQDERIAELQARLSDQRTAVSEPVFGLVASIQQPAANDLTATLGALAEPLAALVAADMVRESLIMGSVLLPAGKRPPFAARPLLEKFLAAIPDRFRPSNLNQELIAARAQEIAGDVKRNIMEGVGNNGDV
jgi:hypothetical protein